MSAAAPCASLPMYWRAETRDAWQAFWRLVQEAAGHHGEDLPPLTAPEDLPSDWATHWTDPGLRLSMTCGLPFRTALRDRVGYVGTLDFGLDGPAGHYHSVVIARPGPLPQAPRLAYNSADSQSGWAAWQLTRPADLPEAADWLATGGHAASLAAVAEGRADLACLDAVTWRLLHRHDPRAAEVRVLAQTAPTPGLPLICAKDRDPAPLRDALHRALEALPPETARIMGGAPLTLAVLTPQDYFAVPNPAPPPTN